MCRMRTYVEKTVDAPTSTESSRTCPGEPMVNSKPPTTVALGGLRDRAPPKYEQSTLSSFRLPKACAPIDPARNPTASNPKILRLRTTRYSGRSCPRLPCAMIVYDTVAKLHAGGYSLTAYCRICERHVTLDMAGLVASGRGHMGIPFRTHCGYCRETGQVTVRPRMAPHSHSNGWI